MIMGFDKTYLTILIMYFLHENLTTLTLKYLMQMLMLKIGRITETDASLLVCIKLKYHTDDCDVGPWERWTSCYLPPGTCGIGSKNRTR